ncbi:hypothetical protein QWZ06_14680 [Chryseobacterium tructae]|uniref:hypothetical protein n=1 Tax=Chryseobacterium tructae TaxID=1037380 RepID=UPI0025B5EA29|nr:hypothetical protein [Chryseobacterium tructae]MDN3693439.1 hypothetical protein [Chryseobacterium tructae]
MKKISILSVSLMMVVSCGKKDVQKENLSLTLQKGFEQTLIYSTSTEGNGNGGMNDATEVKYTIDSVDKDSNYYVTGEIVRMTYNQKCLEKKFTLIPEKAPVQMMKWAWNLNLL